MRYSSCLKTSCQLTATQSFLGKLQPEVYSSSLDIGTSTLGIVKQQRCRRRHGQTHHSARSQSLCGMLVKSVADSQRVLCADFCTLTFRTANATMLCCILQSLYIGYNFWGAASKGSEGLVYTSRSQPSLQAEPVMNYQHLAPHVILTNQYSLPGWAARCTVLCANMIRQDSQMKSM